MSDVFAEQDVIRPRIAILASGEGTTAESFIRAGAEGRIRAQVGLIICNKPEAGIFDRIKRLNIELGLNIKCVHIGRGNHPPEKDEKSDPGAQTRAEEAAIMDLLENGEFDSICLMGYLKRVGTILVSQYGSHQDHSSPYQARMLNTHPGLLPESKGLWGIHVQEHVLEQHLPYSGQSLIVVADDYDAGAVVAEHKVAVMAGDTPGSLFARVQEVEKKYLPGDIDAFIKNRQNYLMEVKIGR